LSLDTMDMLTKEIFAKNILSKSKVSDYTINPYIGCEHACTYCYARFMKRFTGHTEKWGQFLDVKVNAPDLLAREIKRKKMGNVWISGVCDPYQPAEEKYELTRRCLKILLKYDWPVTVQTKSPLVLRDMDLIKQFNAIKVGLSIGTGDEEIRGIFEPNVPSVKDRIEVLKRLHSQGIETFVMIAPLLPKAEKLIPMLDGYTDNVLVDKMNYHHADRIYYSHDLTSSMTERFFHKQKMELSDRFKKRKMEVQFLY
jgi:DNA repair photolyase